MVSGWIRDRNAVGENPAHIDGRILPSIIDRSPPAVMERAERILRYLGRNTRELGQDHDLDDPALQAVSYSSSQFEVGFLAQALHDEGWIDAQLTLDGGGQATVKPAGHRHLDRLQATFGIGDQVFVAMWFSPDLNAAYNEGFEPGISNAGYRAVRIDRVEHANRIDDEIIGQLRKSRFVVADFTGHRGGVYFEAGFAMGLNIPVIWTCRRDDLANLHFDIRQYNCIDWSDPVGLRIALTRRIEAVIGPRVVN